MINPTQLKAELAAAGLPVPLGLGVGPDWNLFAWDRDGNVHDLPDRAYSIVLAHVPMREKTVADFIGEFAAVATPQARRFLILAMLSGLAPRELVRAEDVEPASIQESAVVT